MMRFVVGFVALATLVIGGLWAQVVNAQSTEAATGDQKTYKIHLIVNQGDATVSGVGIELGGETYTTNEEGWVELAAPEGTANVVVVYQDARIRYTIAVKAAEQMQTFSITLPASTAAPAANEETTKEQTSSGGSALVIIVAGVVGLLLVVGVVIFFVIRAKRSRQTNLPVYVAPAAPTPIQQPPAVVAPPVTAVPPVEAQPGMTPPFSLQTTSEAVAASPAVSGVSDMTPPVVGTAPGVEATAASIALPSDENAMQQPTGELQVQQNVPQTQPQEVPQPDIVDFNTTLPETPSLQQAVPTPPPVQQSPRPDEPEDMYEAARRRGLFENVK